MVKLESITNYAHIINVTIFDIGNLFVDETEDGDNVKLTTATINF